MAILDPERRTRALSGVVFIAATVLAIFSAPVGVLAITALIVLRGGPAAGRRGAMVGWLPVLGEDGVDQLVNYVRSLAAGASDPTTAAATQFATYCSACHGPDGTGLALLGGPDLTDDVWIYGSSGEALRMSIAEGRNGIMPAFGNRLDDVQLKLLVAWLTRPLPAPAQMEAVAR